MRHASSQLCLRNIPAELQPSALWPQRTRQPPCPPTRALRFFTCQTSSGESRLVFSTGPRPSSFNSHLPMAKQEARFRSCAGKPQSETKACRRAGSRKVWGARQKRACSVCAAALDLTQRGGARRRASPGIREGRARGASGKSPYPSATWLLPPPPATMFRGHDVQPLPLCSTASPSHGLRRIIIVISYEDGDVESIRLQLFLPPRSLQIPLRPPLSF